MDLTVAARTVRVSHPRPDVPLLAEWTEENLSFDGALWAIPVRWSPIRPCGACSSKAYTTCIMSLQGMGPERIKGEIQATWWNALSAGWRFWPFVHCSPSPPSYPKTSSCCLSTAWRWHGSPSCPRR